MGSSGFNLCQNDPDFSPFFSGIAMILFPYQIQWKKYCSQIVSFPQVLTGKKYLKH